MTQPHFAAALDDSLDDTFQSASDETIQRRPTAGFDARKTFLSLRLTTVAAVFALAGCATTTQGLGGGDLLVKGESKQPVLVSWQSDDGGISGTMVATLPDATFTGNFLQITQQTEETSMAPLWVGWNNGWGDWPYWGNPNPSESVDFYDATRFTRDYSGKVVANLQSDNGDRMRCRFQMNNPARGMSGGGDGECKLTGGNVVAVTIDRQ